MLPSWIERWRHFTAPVESAVLALGRRTAILSVYNNHLLKHRIQVALPVELYRGRAKEAGIPLVPALKELAAGIADRYLPLTVTLPDAAVHADVFELEELPKSHAEQIELARFRMARELSINAADIVCDSQDLGAVGKQRLLFAFAADKLWLQAVTDALQATGFMPWCVTTDTCQRFNTHHDRFVTDGKGAMLIVVSSDAWSLVVWDDAVRPRLLRGRWRDSADDVERMAHDVERIILAWIHGASGRGVARAYVVGDCDDVSRLAAALEARLSEPCIQLETPRPTDTGA